MWYLSSSRYDRKWWLNIQRIAIFLFFKNCRTTPTSWTVQDYQHTPAHIHSITHSFTGTAFPKNSHWVFSLPRAALCTHHSITHSFTGTAFPKNSHWVFSFLVQLLHTSQYHTLVYRNSFPQKQSLSIQSSSCSSCIHHSITHSFTGTAFPKNSHSVFSLPRAAPAYITVSHTRLQEQLSPKTVTEYSVFLVQLLHTSQYHTLVYRNSFPQKQSLSIQSSSCSSAHITVSHTRLQEQLSPKTVTEYSVFLEQLLHTSQYHTLVYRNSFPQKQSLSIQSSSCSSCTHHSITHSFTGTAFPKNSHWVFSLPRAAPAYITVSHTRLQEQLSPKTVTQYSVFLVQLLHTSQYHTLVYRNSFPQKQSLSIQSSSCSSCTHHSITHSFTGTAFPKNSHWVFSLPRAAPAHITVSHTRLQEQLSPKTVTEYSVFLVQPEGDWMMIRLLLVNYTVKDTWRMLWFMQNGWIYIYTT